MLLRRTLLVNGIATAMTGALALFASPWLPARGIAGLRTA